MSCTHILDVKMSILGLDKLGPIAGLGTEENALGSELDTVANDSTSM